jgi:outer membrane receptor for ferrienterochelin and colicins
VKGASSALYGSQAMGGVINIITKKSVKKWQVSAGVKWTQMNERNYPDLQKDDDQYEFKKNLDRQNLNMYLSAGFNLKHINGRTDFVTKSFDAYKLYDKKPITKEFINIDTVIVDDLNPFPTGINGYSDYEISQKLNFPVNKKLDISLRGSYYNHNEYDFVPDKVHQKYIDYTVGGKIVYSFSDKTNITGSFNYDNYKKYDYYEKLDDMSVNYKNIYVDPKVTVFSQIGKIQELTGGLEYFSETLFSDVLFADTNQDKRSETYTGFIQDDINAAKNLDFIIGARLDYHSVYGTHFSPKISGMYKLKHFTFRTNYAQGFRSPSLKELFIDWQVAWFTIKGNKDLKPETNNYLSGSVEYVNKLINISATGYYNKIKNKIDGIWENGQTVYQYVNVSEAELSGVEMLAKISLPGNLILSGGYNYLHDKRPQGELVSSASPHTGNVKLNYHFTKKNYELNATISSTIIGAKDFIMSDYITYRGQYVEGFYPVHFDAYSIWRLSVSQHFYNGLHLVVGVDNLFDYTADVVSFNTSMSPGRRFFISLNLDFEELIKFKSTK